MGNKGRLVTCPREMDDLFPHVGHKIACVYYGKSKKEAYNVAIECETCGQVLLDIDRSTAPANPSKRATK